MEKLLTIQILLLAAFLTKSVYHGYQVTSNFKKRHIRQGDFKGIVDGYGYNYAEYGPVQGFAQNLNQTATEWQAFTNGGSRHVNTFILSPLSAPEKISDCIAKLVERKQPGVMDRDLFHIRLSTDDFLAPPCRFRDANIAQMRGITWKKEKHIINLQHLGSCTCGPANFTVSHTKTGDILHFEGKGKWEVVFIGETRTCH